MRSTRRQIDHIVTQAERLHDRLPRAIDNLEILAADGYPAHTPLSDTPRGGTTTDADGYPETRTSVEAAVLQRQRHSRHWRTLLHSLHAVASHLDMLNEICDRYDVADAADSTTAQQCVAGNGIDGWELWGRRDSHGQLLDTCGQLAEPGRSGLCLGCYHRQRRWKGAQR